MEIQNNTFGQLPDGRKVNIFTLVNDNEMTVKITPYGAIITEIVVPGKDGKKNIVLGFDKLEDYLSETYLGSYPYFGAIIGRYGNRIAGGHLEIEGKVYNLAINNGPNHLHGGLSGFDKKLWEATPFEEPERTGVKMTYLSPDGEENYPGNLQVTCIYALNNQNELSIEYYAITDKSTVVNLTNHTYFNLNGGKENILNHELMLTANQITEAIDLIPTGKIIPVKGTPFDFSAFKPFSRDIAGLPNGYDNNFVLGNESGELKFAGCLRETASGRSVEVYTTQPGIQLYTGYWNPELTIGGEKKFGSYSGVALETQHYPDSVHHAGFPSTLLNPGEEYRQKTVYRFGF